MQALEVVFIGLLVASTIAVGWFASFVVYRLFKGQH